MQALARVLFGYVRVAVRGVRPAQAISALAAADVPFSGTAPEGDYAIAVTVPERRLAQVRALAARCGCTVDEIARGGMPGLLRRVWRRRAFAALLALAVGAVLVSSLFIWDVEVTGNARVSTGELLRALEDSGVYPGAYWPALSNDLVRNRMILKIPELQWLTVQMHGSAARVVVREKTDAPEVVDNDEAVSIYAAADGFVLELQVLGGEARVAPGELVTQGQLLVTGAVRDALGGVRAAHALGSVRGRALYTLTAAAPLTETARADTGRARTRWALVIGKKRINFYQSSGIPDGECVKIKDEYALAIPGVFRLPLSLVRERTQTYETRPRAVSVETAREALEQALTAQLQARIGADGEVISAAFTAAEHHGVLLVTLRAECEQELGVSRASAAEEFTQEGTPTDDRTDD